MIRVLAIGDPHFKGSYTSSTGARAGRRGGGNKLQTNLMVHAIMKRIEQLKPDIIVVLGDLLDRFGTISTIAQCDAGEWIYAMGEALPNGQVYVLTGNHDRPDNHDYMSSYSALSLIRNQKNIFIVNQTTHYYCAVLDRYFLFVPYVPPGRFNDALEPYQKKIDRNRVCCIFAHQEFKGSHYTGTGSMESTAGDRWSKDSPFVVSGHIHNYQRLRKNILYVGTPIQHEFEDDPTEKTISLLTFVAANNDRKPEEERISLSPDVPGRRKLTLSTKEVKKWEPSADFLWKICVVAKTSSELSMFVDSKKYHRLKEQGVIVNTRRLPSTHTEDIQSPTQKTIALNFRVTLAERVKDQEGQKRWLQKILSNL